MIFACCGVVFACFGVVFACCIRACPLMFVVFARCRCFLVAYGVCADRGVVLESVGVTVLVILMVCQSITNIVGSCCDGNYDMCLALICDGFWGFGVVLGCGCFFEL